MVKEASSPTLTVNGSWRGISCFINDTLNIFSLNCDIFFVNDSWKGMACFINDTFNTWLLCYDIFFVLRCGFIF